jgi:hypothetical protein
MEFPDGAGMGAGGKLDFWLVQDPEARPQHVAFHAPDRSAVDAFHAAALAAGGTDNGPPGLRLEYHPNYYAAFVYDPSGHNMEAVHHRPPAAAQARPAASRRATAKKGQARQAGPKRVAAKARRAAAKPAKKRSAKGRKG